MKESSLPVAIILAGGQGSRLKSVASLVPKPLADINGRPFLAYLLDFLASQGISEVILSVGYKSDMIIDHFQDQYGNIQIKYANEDQPLGTGGAIRNALQFVSYNNVFVLNGDTYFSINLSTLLDFHKFKSSCVTVALKHMRIATRYGKVTINAENKVIGIIEKGHRGPGLINGGIYLVSRDLFNGIDLSDKFSFELDFLKIFYRQKAIYGCPFNDYFTDIGVPLDYERAKSDFKRLEY